MDFKAAFHTLRSEVTDAVIHLRHHDLVSVTADATQRAALIFTDGLDINIISKVPL